MVLEMKSLGRWFPLVPPVLYRFGRKYSAIYKQTPAPARGRRHRARDDVMRLTSFWVVAACACLASGRTAEEKEQMQKAIRMKTTCVRLSALFERLMCPYMRVTCACVLLLVQSSTQRDL